MNKTSTIQKIHARQILDSRGNPTVEVDLVTSNGKCARASVPSGASTGTREALELRDLDLAYYAGKSVQKAIKNINDVIFPKIKGMSVFEQAQIDARIIELDGTPDKSKLGANALLGVSLASARAGSMEWEIPLYQYLSTHLSCPKNASTYKMPIPLMNVINGGAHASNNLDFQEFMIVPNLKSGFKENLRAGVEVFMALKSLLKGKNLSTNVGDEGGFAPDLSSHEMAMELLLEAIHKAKYTTEQIKISLDCAASEFYDENAKKYKMQERIFTSEEMIQLYVDFVKKYPIFSIEDGLSELDHLGHQSMTKIFSQMNENRTLLIGDDLFVTNKEIFAQGIKNKECNSILIKLNQIGTLTQTFETMDLAYKNNYATIVSHRSGETADTFIADLAVATSSGYIKTGSLCRSDRVEKYNQLLRIEESLL